jgi:hypothetical protein
MTGLGAATDQRGREGMPQDVLVPTSAQAHLCRPRCYAELGEKGLLRRFWAQILSA